MPPKKKMNVETDEVKQKNSKHVKYQSKIKEVLCVEGCKAIFMCISKKCKKPAFICAEQKCVCEKVHALCSTKKIHGIISQIQENLNKFEPIIRQNELLIDKRIAQYKNIIQNLIKSKQQLKTKLKQTQLCGLQNCQKIIYKAILSKKTDQIRGCDIYQIDKELDQQNRFSVQSQIQKLREVWQRNKSKSKNLEEQLLTELGQYYQNRLYRIFSQKSNILTTIKQISALNHPQLFSDNVQKLQLLYRASLNNFQIQNFKAKCTYIPRTFTLIHTSQNYKFGIYTPSQWEKTDGIIQDPQGAQTTLLSIKNRTCFAGYSISNKKQYGPCFFDIDNKKISASICNKNNINHSINQQGVYGVYVNEQSKQKQESKFYQKNFTTKEWQVWRVVFKQQKQKV